MTPIEMREQCKALGESKIRFNSRRKFQHGLPACDVAFSPNGGNWDLSPPLGGCWMELRDETLHVVVWDGTAYEGCENRGPFDTVEEALQYIYLLQAST